MLYNNFREYTVNDHLIFETGIVLPNVVSIEKISFTNIPQKEYIIEADFNGGGYIEVDRNILYTLNEILDESVDIKIKFIFDISDNVGPINIQYTTAYEIMLGVVDAEVLKKLCIVNDGVADDEDKTTNTMSIDNSESFSNANNKVAFWKGNYVDYQAIQIKNPDTLYYVIDTKSFYLGTINMSSSSNVSWGNKVTNQSVVLDVNSVPNTLSLSTHTHNNYVPTSRNINNKSLVNDITLSASDVGALGVSDTAQNALKLGGLAADKFWNDANSNRDNVDWSAKNMSVNGVATIKAGSSSTTALIYGMRLLSGGTTVGMNTTIGFNVENSATVKGPKGAISYMRTGAYDCGKFVFFLSDNVTDGNGVTTNDAKLTIENDGRLTAKGRIFSGANEVYHGGIVNLNSVDWRAKALSLNGGITGATTGSFSSNVNIGGTLGVTSAATFNSTIESTGNIKTRGSYLIGDNVEMRYNTSTKSLQMIFK